MSDFFAKKRVRAIRRIYLKIEKIKSQNVGECYTKDFTVIKHLSEENSN